MKRSGCLVVSALLLTAAPPGRAADRFELKLPAERQIVHVLNRLTFGPRPGDVDRVRRIGIDAWIDQQLHPDRLTEHPALGDKLRALVTLDLPTWKILESYPPVPAALMTRLPSAEAFASLTPQQRNILTSCSVQERTAALAAFDPEKRRLVLAAAGPQITEGLPDALVQEGVSARKAEQEARQKEIRRLMPPLNELLSPEQIRTANARDGRREAGAPRLARCREAPAGPSRAAAAGVRRAAGAAPRSAWPHAQPQQFVNGELIENKLYRAVYSNRQLEEVLVDFWLNHFNVFNGKGQGRVLLTSYERDAIRPHVLGHFKDLLLATARHPAMLFYLDNWQSQVAARRSAPPPPGVRRPGLNENYGRELMELHTLGVDGGYTQDDVIAVARAFTGWTIYDLQKFAEFQFNPAMHDRKEKIVLGHTIPAWAASRMACR